MGGGVGNRPFADQPIAAVDTYSSGVGRRKVFLRRRPQKAKSAPEQFRIFLIGPDEIDQVFDAEVGEGLDAVFSDAIDPDDAVFDLHFIGDVPQPVLIFAEVLGDAIDCGDVMNFVDVHGHAARAEIADTGGVQFQGRSSCDR